MGLLSTFLMSFGMAIGPVISPGPVSTAVVVESARRGFRVGPLVSTGHALVELVMVATLVLGTGQLVDQPIFGFAVGLLGGLVLLYSGAVLVRGTIRDKPTLPSATDTSPDTGRNLLGIGVAATLGNPFWYAWWVGVGGSVLASWEEGPLALLAFYLGHVSVDYTWNTLLATVIASGRPWLTDKAYRVLLVVSGLFLIYTGVIFIWTGIQNVLV